MANQGLRGKRRNHQPHANMVRGDDLGGSC
jgi:hypothetical protein